LFRREIAHAGLSAEAGAAAAILAVLARLRRRTALTRLCLLSRLRLPPGTLAAGSLRAIAAATSAL
jgi:hypothetical protein